MAKLMAISVFRITFSQLIIWVIICLVTLPGCISFPVPPETSLSVPTHSEYSFSRKAWIRHVKLPDDVSKDMSGRIELENSLRENITSYIHDSGVFIDVKPSLGKLENLENNDLVLDFLFDSYSQKRQTHPLYIPLTGLTFYLYKFFGGPVYIDSSDISVVLAVQNKIGTSLANVSSQVHEKHNVSLWSSDYFRSSGIEARDSLMHDLMDKVSIELPSKTKK